MTAQHTAIQQHHPDEFASGRICHQRCFADEIAVAFQVHCPCQSGFQRIDGFVHVLAIQIHPGFETQGIAGTKANRLHAFSRQRRPKIGCRFCREHNLKTIFAGVAGTRDEHRAHFYRAERGKTFG